MTKRCVLYARISDARKDQDTENQLMQLREFAARTGWTVVHEYVDRASGKSAKRPQFQVMFEAASRREYDVCLFWALDRLSREGVVETLQHLQRLGSYGVEFRSYTEQYLDSTGPMRDAVIGILAAVAKHERLRISERVKAGLERARAKGRTLGRAPALDDRRLVVEVAKLRSRGLSVRGIAVKVKKSPTTIQKLLRG